MWRGHISPQIARPADTRNNNTAETAAAGNACGCPPTPQDRRRPFTDTKNKSRRADTWPQRASQILPHFHPLQADTAFPPARYTITSTDRSQKLPRAAFKSQPSRHHLPPYRSARDVSRLHQLTAAAGEDQFRREATLYHRPSHPTPGLPCQNTPSPARFGSTPDALPTHQSDGHINGSSPVVTSHQPANRLLPLSPNSVDRRRPLGRCQSVRVSAPGRVMTLRRAADTISAAAPWRPSRSGAGYDRWGPICVPTRWKEVRVWIDQVNPAVIAIDK